MSHRNGGRFPLRAWSGCIAAPLGSIAGRSSTSSPYRRSVIPSLADWLVACGITTVAMEATGVYWIPIYGILEGRGLEVPDPMVLLYGRNPL